VAFPVDPLDVQVQIALSADLTDSAGWTWTDVTDYVFANTMITIRRGRSDEFQQTPASTCSMRVDNSDGRWTRSNPLGAWHGQLRKNTPIRVRVNFGAGYVTRFTGFISAAPTTWDKSENLIYADISATGVIRRLERQTTARSLLYRAHTNAAFASDLRAYWPMEDESGSTQFASATGGPAMTIGGDAPSLASASDMAGSDSLPVLDAMTLLAGQVPPYPSTGAWGLRFAARVDQAVGTGQALLRWHTDGGAAYWQLVLEPSTTPDRVRLEAYNAANVELLGHTGVEFVDGAGAQLYDRQLYIEVNAVQSGSDVDWDFTVFHDGGSGQSTNGTETGLALGNVRRVVYGNGSGANLLDSYVLGHIAVASTNSVSFGAGFDGATGGEGETTLLRYTRISATEGFDGDVDVAAQTPMGPERALAVMAQVREIAATEAGLLHERTDGQLYLTGRSSLTNQTAALTLDKTAGEWALPPVAQDDLQEIVNSVTASKPRGSSATHTVTGGATGTDTVGTYEQTVNVNPYQDGSLDDYAAWYAHLGTYDGARFPQFSINLARATARIDDWLACDIGSRIVLANPPSPLPPDDIDLLLQGYTEILGTHVWTVTANASPGEPWLVHEIEDDEHGRLDTVGSYLLTDVTAGATSWLVATGPQEIGTGDDYLAHARAGPGWSTTAEPYDWYVAGERVTATAVTSQTPTLVAAGTVGHGNNASVTPGMPAGVQAGDLLLVYAAIRNDSAGLVETPSGYTRLATVGGHNAVLYGKIHTGTEVAPTVTFTGGAAGDDTTAQMAAFRYTQLWTCRQELTLTAPQQNISYPEISTPRANCLVLFLGWKQDDWTSVSSPGTEIGEPDTTTGSDQGIVWSYSTQTTPAFVAAGSFTVTGGGLAITNGATVMLPGDVQTVTVQRAVNGVSKAQSAGESISDWRPGTGGLSL
jgi:hypothetical protein